MARDPEAVYEEIYPGPRWRIRDGDQQYYVPPTGERFLSVTSALEHRAKEDLDHRWRPRLSAEAAFRELPRLVAATLTPDCGQTYGVCSRKDTRKHDQYDALGQPITCPLCPCGKCPRCLIKYLSYEHYRESYRATTRGSAFHHWSEDWVLEGGNVELVWAKFRAKCGRRTEEAVEAWVDTIRPYVESFLRFVSDFGLTPENWLMAEATILNREYMYGGTLDGRLQLSYKMSPLALKLCKMLGNPNPVVSLDTKTREADNAQFYDENALQLAPYDRGQVVLLDDGTELPFERSDGGLVVQVRPDGYGWRLVDISERTFEAFLGTLAQARWTIEHGKAATQVKSFPLLPLSGVDEEALKPPPRKRAARKVAVPAVSSDRAADVAAATGRGLVDVPLPLADAKPARPAPSNATLDSMRGIQRSFPDDDIPF